MPSLTELNYVNAAGQPVDLEVLKTKHRRPPRPVSDALKRVDDRSHAKESHGFQVLGYPPDLWASIPKAREQQIESHTADPLTVKHPGTLEEFTTAWLRKNRPKRARSKPYFISEAADKCAEIARKAGWVHVRVEEILKG